jgi:hypothetical protein
MLFDILDTNDVLMGVMPPHEALGYLQHHPGFTCRHHQAPPDPGGFTLDPYPSRPTHPLAALLVAADAVVSELAGLPPDALPIPLIQALGIYHATRPYVEFP